MADLQLIVGILQTSEPGADGGDDDHDLHRQEKRIDQDIKSLLGEVGYILADLGDDDDDGGDCALNWLFVDRGDDDGVRVGLTHFRNNQEQSEARVTGNDQQGV